MKEFNEYDTEPQNSKVKCCRCKRTFYDDDIDVLFDNYICPHCIKKLLKTDVERLIDMASKCEVCKTDIYILLQNVKQINKEKLKQ